MQIKQSQRPISLQNYQQLDVTHDKEAGIVWCSMTPSPRPCFNPQILQELRNFQDEVAQNTVNQPDEFRYMVWTSGLPATWNLGGDLALFQQLIDNRDRMGLMQYAKACIDVVYPNHVSFGVPITTISLVQGTALGGGFEAAMSSNVLIAERSTRMGLPEILFNLFPGMGAYSFLSRKIGPAKAERFILSGNTWSAEELYEMGIVDVLADDGDGVKATNDFIKKHARYRNGAAALRRVSQSIDPISYAELIDVTKIWVDAALELTSKDLKTMKRLVRAQERLQFSAKAQTDQAVA